MWSCMFYCSEIIYSESSFESIQEKTPLIIAVSWQPVLGSLHTGKQLSEYWWEVIFVIFTSYIEEGLIRNVSILGFEQWG